MQEEGIYLFDVRARTKVWPAAQGFQTGVTLTLMRGVLPLCATCLPRCRDLRNAFTQPSRTQRTGWWKFFLSLFVSTATPGDSELSSTSPTTSLEAGTVCRVSRVSILLLSLLLADSKVWVSFGSLVPRASVTFPTHARGAGCDGDDLQGSSILLPAVLHLSS